MPELLFEIGTEEIPAGYLQPALQSMESYAAKKFRALSLGFASLATVATPRRLTLVVRELQGRQEDREERHLGPATRVGLDGDGKPTKAAIGFARSKGVAVEDLHVVETEKGEYLMAVEKLQGRETAALLPEFCTELIKEISFPKSMRWADGSLTFARPIQWLLALYDGAVVDFSVENATAGNTTRGHRFMAPETFSVAGFSDYGERLAKQFVIVDPAQRRQMVVAEVSKVVTEQGVAGAAPVLDDALIDTVTNLVEMPCGVCGSFDRKFLELPEEVLITSMREHQKYFPVRGADGKLLPMFVAVNNTRVTENSLAVSGHERVLRARLEDAHFFYREDGKTKLIERLDALSGIIFQNRLGTMLEKSRRIETLASFLCDELLPEAKQDASRVAKLAKNDLLTAMVGEFPTLQGLMGREYALRDGESPAVATAIYEHYLPVRAGGELPATLLGAIVGLADRIDTVAGCFAIKERPTGTADPFGLRRLSLGILHILQGLKISLSLPKLIDAALAGYRDIVQPEPDTAAQVLEFIRLRFENDCIAGGSRPEVVQAATSVAFDDVVETRSRIVALETIRQQEQFAILAGSFKRIRNIVKENDDTEVSASLLEHEAEKNLFRALSEVREQVEPLLDRKEYLPALEAMLGMKESLDRFFDDVMVMAEDPALRRNRLNLLTALGQLVLRVGDISRMHGE